MYRKRNTGQIVTKQQLLEAHRHISLPIVWTAQTHDALQIDPVYVAEKPLAGDYEIVVEGAVRYEDGRYIPGWAIQPMFQEYVDADGVTHTVAEQISKYESEEILKTRQAMVVTMRQARLALLGAGKLSLVDDAISLIPEPDHSAIKVEWEYANSVERNSPWMTLMGQALGMTDEDLDALFLEAEGL